MKQLIKKRLIVLKDGWGRFAGWKCSRCSWQCRAASTSGGIRFPGLLLAAFSNHRCSEYE
jgi:hypothetical protein